MRVSVVPFAIALAVLLERLMTLPTLGIAISAITYISVITSIRSATGGSIASLFHLV